MFITHFHTHAYISRCVYIEHRYISVWLQRDARRMIQNRNKYMCVLGCIVYVCWYVCASLCMCKCETFNKLILLLTLNENILLWSYYYLLKMTGLGNGQNRLTYSLNGGNCDVTIKCVTIKVHTCMKAHSYEYAHP